MITGVLLAGGKSSRFGRPKMFETWQNAPLYAVGLNSFRELNYPIVISTNKQLVSKFNELDVKFITDDKLYEGPLYALCSVMQQIESDWYFMIAADMPYINAAFMETLATHVSDDVDAIIPTADGKWQPLAALYHRRALPQAMAALKRNRRSMKALLQEVRVSFVEMNDTKTFKNINYVEDWPQHEGDA